MKIDWILSEKLRAKAIRISKAKEQMTYVQLASAFGLHRTYIIELKKLGDQLRKEQDGQV